MGGTCNDPVPVERLVEYLLGELEPRDEQRLEEHLFSCATCASAAETLAGLAASIRATVPTILSRSRFDALEASGLVSELNPMAPGDVAHVVFPPSGKLLVHRLSADLGRAQRVDVELRTPDGEAVGRLENVPFDAERGELLVACQRHFAERFPHDLVLGLDVVSGDERRRVAEYTVLHRLA